MATTNGPATAAQRDKGQEPHEPQWPFDMQKRRPKDWVAPPAPPRRAGKLRRLGLLLAVVCLGLAVYAVA